MGNIADLAYFVGCVSAMFPMSYGIPQSFATVLGRAGVSFTTLGGDEHMAGAGGKRRDPAVRHGHDRGSPCGGVLGRRRGAVGEVRRRQNLLQAQHGSHLQFIR